MTNALRLAAFLAVIGLVNGGNAQTCTSQQHPNNSAGSICFTAGEGILPSQITAATDLWAECAQFGMGFPSLSTTGGDFAITVVRRSERKFGDADGCGQFDGLGNANLQITGGTIVVFDADILGHDCEPSRVATIAHEMGHVLGLANSECPGHIMSAGGSERSVQPGECAAADAAWTTPPEVPARPGEQLHWDSGTYWFDPLVLDLRGDAIATTGAESPVIFDLDADGFSERVTWLDPSSGDAFLWTDLDGDHRLENGSELFGVGTTLPDGTKARHGFEALVMYDLPAYGGDGNGTIDSSDDVWNRLRLWLDEDHDGICDPGESAPIHRYGVEQIWLSWTRLATFDPGGTLRLLAGVYARRERGAIVLREVEALGFRKIE